MAKWKVVDRGSEYPKYPAPGVIQFTENVFVWFDETGSVGGAGNSLVEALFEQEAYAETLK